jgi:hypothetical protein
MLSHCFDIAADDCYFHFLRLLIGYDIIADIASAA